MNVKMGCAHLHSSIRAAEHLTMLSPKQKRASVQGTGWSAESAILSTLLVCGLHLAHAGEGVHFFSQLV